MKKKGKKYQAVIAKVDTTKLYTVEDKVGSQSVRPTIRRILQATARNKKPYTPAQMQCMTAHRADYLEREIINRITRAVCGESRMHGS